jgi:hypothetical protein
LVATWTPSDCLDVNAPTALHIPTPDGSGQAVHPDVLHVPGGFLGFEYWLACTPYPFGADRLENPIVRVSHDGIDWQPFDGAPDPLVPEPEDHEWHHADTDIVLHEGVLYVFYISTNRVVGGTVFSYVSTRDGVRWTKPVVIYRAPWGVSPALVVEGPSTWSMWYVYRDALARENASKIHRCTGTGPDSLASTSLCDLELPGHVVWHLDVVVAPGGYEALVAAFPEGTDPSRCRLFHTTSTDGIKFVPSSTRAVVAPSWFGWDNRFVYRSTMQLLPGGRKRIWYSAASWGMRTGIGLLEGPLDDLRPVATGPTAPGTRKRWRQDAVGLAKYLVYRILPQGAYQRLVAIRGRRSQVVSR